MRAPALILAVSLLLPSVSWAQDPAPTAEPTAEATAAIGVGDTVFSVDETPSTRFPDADESGPTFSSGSKLIVLVAENGSLRVMSAADNTFGWIPQQAVTAEKPELDMEALLQSLGGGAGGPGMGGGAGAQ